MATGLVAGETKHEADEFLDLEPMMLSRALEMVESGEIMDAKTALALLYAAGFRAGR
jgi:ADP-ribose pyrophosphatase